MKQLRNTYKCVCVNSRQIMSIENEKKTLKNLKINYTCVMISQKKLVPLQWAHEGGTTKVWLGLINSDGRMNALNSAKRCDGNRRKHDKKLRDKKQTDKKTIGGQRFVVVALKPAHLEAGALLIKLESSNKNKCKSLQLMKIFFRTLKCNWHLKF